MPEQDGEEIQIDWSAPEEALEAYLSIVHGPDYRPGEEEMERYFRDVPQEEMDADHAAFVEFAQGRHEEETVVCLGTGPSVQELPAEVLDRFTTIGCNGIGSFYEPDYYVIADPMVYGLHRSTFLSSRSMRILSSFTRGRCDRRIYYPYENLVGLSREALYSADNTGFLQLSIAFVMGASRIILAGYDGYAGEEDFHFYNDSGVEQGRVAYEWEGKVGEVRRNLLTTAFSEARRIADDAGVELRYVPPSSYLSNILDPMRTEVFLGHG